MRRPIIALILVAFALLAVPAWAAGPTVAVKDASFGPQKLTVHQGTRVTFRWKGSLPHNVRAVRGPKRFHSKTGTHLVYRYTFRTKGRYVLECTVHGYRMTVRVR